MKWPGGMKRIDIFLMRVICHNIYNYYTDDGHRIKGRPFGDSFTRGAKLADMKYQSFRNYACTFQMRWYVREEKDMPQLAYMRDVLSVISNEATK